VTDLLTDFSRTNIVGDSAGNVRSAMLFWDGLDVLVAGAGLARARWRPE